MKYNLLCVVALALCSCTASPPTEAALFVRGCGLYTVPTIATLDKPEMRTWFGNDAAYCQEASQYLIGAPPMLSANGHYLLITNPRQSWLADLRQGDLAEFMAAEILATWHPTAERFTYVLDEQLWIAEASNPNQPQVLFAHTGLDRKFARWSPDGRWIAVVSHTEDLAQLTFWAVEAKSGIAKELGSTPNLGLQTAPSDVQWAADSQAIATFTRHIFYMDGRSEALETLAEVDWWPPSHAQKLIGPAVDPKWEFSSTGDTLAVAVDTPDGAEVSLIQTATQSKTILGVIPNFRPLQVRWGLNGEQIYVGGLRPNETAPAGGTFVIYVVRTTSAPPELLIKDAQLVSVLPRP